MPRPTFTSKLSLPHRLKHPQSSNSNGANLTPTSVPQSRNGSPKPKQRSDMSEQHQVPGLVLRANVIKGRDLAAKDRSGTSDPVGVPSPPTTPQICL
ncbi:C2 domain containing protein [Pyrenophora tritici-repentis]|nr:C2 domain containing protein [Pyrenophora tritici-repentis]KAG9384071.1 C2 domain containing protein [Pyrenophora tritici-repentis]